MSGEHHGLWMQISSYCLVMRKGMGGETYCCSPGRRYARPGRGVSGTGESLEPFDRSCLLLVRYWRGLNKVLLLRSVEVKI